VLTSPKHGSKQDGLETIEGVSCYRTGPAHGRWPFVRELALMSRMAARIVAVARAEGARLLHAHSPLLNGVPALWAGRRLGLPVVYEARAFWEDAAVDHGSFRQGSFRYRVSRALETVVFRRADHVVTICEGMRAEVLRRGLASDRVTVVGNGVDAEWFSPRPRPEALAARLGLDGGPVFGFIGSFYHYEGLRFLLRAFPAILRRLPSAQLLLVGGGNEEPVVRDMALAFGNSVVLAGRVPMAETRDYYSLLDVFVCPRRRMPLTDLVTPLKPLEAMAMARAVLASDVGGLRELIRHEATGLLFPAESAEALVAEAVRAGRDRQLRTNLGAAARRQVAEWRNWERVVSRYQAIYADLV
jgi:PEP-CTERM/exosortase A-associated glycosyltransferase